MTTTLPLRVEVSIPRAVYDQWPRHDVLQAVLREQGVFPVHAQEVRWRMDLVNAGWIVSYSVPVSLAGEERP